MATALQEERRLAARLGLPSGLAYDNGSNQEPDIVGWKGSASSGWKAHCLIEVKTGTSLFNWSRPPGGGANVDQLTRYRKEPRLRVSSKSQRLLVLPRKRAVAYQAVPPGNPLKNVPYGELNGNWTLVPWEDITTYLAFVTPREDAAARKAVDVLKAALRVRA